MQSIEVFLQPPSPTLSNTKLPSVKSLLPPNSLEDQEYAQQLPSIRLTHNEQKEDDDQSYTKSPRLNTIEPQLDLSSTSPYQSNSPIMTFSSSPSSTTSSIVGSPLISPINDGPFLLPPPPDISFRRCRSASNASSEGSPSHFRSLSEPPSLSSEEEEENIFGPKRKRGRPPNASRPEIQTDGHFTFVKPTVWDVKQQQHTNSTQQFYTTITTETATENTINDGINTFTTTNMDMALSIPKKKRGRKPKKQLAGNSCFVWKDLTAPRGANKKSLQVPLRQHELKKYSSSSSSSSSGKSTK